MAWSLLCFHFVTVLTVIFFYFFLSRDCPGAKVVTASGIFINGYYRSVGLPASSADAVGLLATAHEGLRLKVAVGRHPVTKRRTIQLVVGGHVAMSFTNDDRTIYVPCIDLADERILSIKCPEHPTHKGLCVHLDSKKCLYTNPEEKIEDFQREVNMHKRVFSAANQLGQCFIFFLIWQAKLTFSKGLGHLVPELLGPGLCFVGPDKDPAIVSRHLGAPESAALRFTTPRDIADVIRVGSSALFFWGILLKHPYLGQGLALHLPAARRRGPG